MMLASCRWCRICSHEIGFFALRSPSLRQGSCLQLDELDLSQLCAFGALRRSLRYLGQPRAVYHCDRYLKNKPVLPARLVCLRSLCRATYSPPAPFPPTECGFRMPAVILNGVLYVISSPMSFVITVAFPFWRGFWNGVLHVGILGVVFMSTTFCVASGSVGLWVRNYIAWMAMHIIPVTWNWVLGRGSYVCYLLYCVG